MVTATDLISWWRSFEGNRVAEKLNLQTIKDARGNLTVMEKLPFDIKRVYFLHGIQEGATRGGHAQKTTERLMVAVNGSFHVAIRGKHWKDVVLDDPSVGLRIMPKEWIELSEFSQGAVCMVLASTEHSESDSVRDFSAFVRLLKSAASCACNQGRLPCDCERSVQ